MTTYVLDRPCPDLIAQSIHNINTANLPVDPEADPLVPQIVFAGDSLYEMPIGNALTESWPYLVTKSARLVGYAQGGKLVSPIDPELPTHSEPVWDVDCYVIWPTNADESTESHYADVENARVVFMQVWGKYRNLDTQSALWVAAGINTPPSPWRLQVMGYDRHYLNFEGREEPFISLYFCIRVTEMLAHLPE